MLLKLPDAVLDVLFKTVNSTGLIKLGQVCHQLAKRADSECQRRLSDSGVRMPRRPRGELADSIYPWRTLLLQYVCKCCHQQASFQIVDQRRVVHGRLCSDCIKEPKPGTVRILSSRFLTVETEGLDGKQLFKPKRKRSKRLPR
eukprot:TRINITY_DN7514_c0_g1_i1.p1 TRINITY_DN7514_c0_g1~~TRINITY_DN7514_c0_g1_i1.p1  ORF type:complete len:144 (+),score=22.64 TRINITY_DN7514_c0_g1_i1:51-482(+)